MPRVADFAAWVAGVEEAEELRAALLIEAFIGLRQQASTPIERVVSAAAMAHGVVLHAAAALIELVVREFHDVERIRDLYRVGEHRVEHRPIRA